MKEVFGPPDIYLGSDVDKVLLEDGITVWSMNCVEYLCGAIKNVDYILEDDKVALKSSGDGHCPYPLSYRPESDVTNELDADLINMFYQLIGILSCSIEVGRIEIMTEVSFCINIYVHLMRGTLILSIFFSGTYRRIYQRIQEGYNFIHIVHT